MRQASRPSIHQKSKTRTPTTTVHNDLDAQHQCNRSKPKEFTNNGKVNLFTAWDEARVADGIERQGGRRIRNLRAMTGGIIDSNSKDIRDPTSATPECITNKHCVLARRADVHSNDCLLQ